MNIYKEAIKRMLPDLYIHHYNKMMRDRINQNSRLAQLPSEQYPKLLEGIYYKKLGRMLDLENPQSYTEKMQWLKLYDSTKLKSDWTDKIKAKKLAAEVIGAEHIVPIIGNPGGARSFDEIDFSSLPNQFVLKTNHGSGCNFIVKNKKHFLRSGEKRIAQARFNALMQMDFGFDDGFELHYSAIDRRIFVEKYIPVLSDIKKEYRFLCFNGTPFYCEVKTEGKRGASFRNIYDMQWNPQNIRYVHEPTDIECKPERFDEMYNMAVKLSKGFPHVRVDLNSTPDRVYFVELTFTNGSGFVKIDPIEFDYKLGQLLNLPERG